MNHSGSLMPERYDICSIACGAETGITKFRPNTFWNVIKHRHFGRVQVAHALCFPMCQHIGCLPTKPPRLYIGALFYDIVPAAEGWYNVVLKWINAVRMAGVLVPTLTSSDQVANFPRKTEEANCMNQNEVEKALMNSVSTPEEAWLFIDDHLEDAKRQVDKLKEIQAASANCGGMPNFEASDAVFTLFARLASALDASVAQHLPTKPKKVKKQFKNFTTLLQSIDPATHPQLEQLKDAHRAVDNFPLADRTCTIAANCTTANTTARKTHVCSTTCGAETGTKKFTAVTFWLVIKHRHFGRVQVAVNTRPTPPVAYLHIGALFHNIVPAVEGWYNLVLKWIHAVRTAGVLVPMAQP